MWNWIKALWNKAVKAFKEFVSIALPIATQIIIGELKDFAVDVVSQIDIKDMTNEQKRKEAFALIKKEATNRGLSVSTSLINTLIELAVQYVKELK